MNILIIGNGFDLAHDLPTKYKDFMDFVYYLSVYNHFGKEKSEEEQEFTNKIIDKPIQRKIDKLMKEKSGSELYKIAKSNIWIKYFKNNCSNKKGWVDFENEISNVIKELDKLRKKNTNSNNPIDSDKFSRADKILKLLNVKKEDFVVKDVEEIVMKLVDELNKLIRALEIYLIEVIGKIDVKCQLNDIIGIGQIDKILSFNYTNTYEKYYDNNFQEDKYDYIHGRIRRSNDSPNNMVLGIDEYLDDDKKDKEVDFIQFKKYFQRIYKKTGCEYKKWVEEIKSRNEKFDKKESWLREELEGLETNLYIFGHSLDITDKDILKELIMLPRTTTTIYYYDNDAYKQYIVNLVKLIGQDKLTDWVHGSNPRIKFVQQQ